MSALRYAHFAPQTSQSCAPDQLRARAPAKLSPEDFTPAPRALAAAELRVGAAPAGAAIDDDDDTPGGSMAPWQCPCPAMSRVSSNTSPHVQHACGLRPDARLDTGAYVCEFPISRNCAVDNSVTHRHAGAHSVVRCRRHRMPRARRHGRRVRPPMCAAYPMRV